jgi:hypothetical protein
MHKGVPPEHIESRYVVCQREGCDKALFLGRVKPRLGG